jgi:hypothetical protein
MGMTIVADVLAKSYLAIISSHLQLAYSTVTLYIIQRSCLLNFKNLAHITLLVLLILWFVAKF